jgi:hypothetical protein
MTTYIAPNQDAVDRYFRIFQTIKFKPKKIVKLVNIVTGYKIIVNEEDELYDSYIQCGGDKWINRKISSKYNPADLDFEISSGFLVKQDD